MAKLPDEPDFPPNSNAPWLTAADHQPFLRRILADPEDPLNYGVYADWLTEREDPRGEFIHVQLLLEDESLKTSQRNELRQREKHLLANHEDVWLGPVYDELLIGNSLRIGPDFLLPEIEYRFERGFLASLRVKHLYVQVARAIRDAPATRFLRELVIEQVESDEHEFEPGSDVPITTANGHRTWNVGAYPLLGVEEFTCLQSFQVGIEGEADVLGTESPENLQTFNCYCSCLPAADIVAKMPNLRRLDLLCRTYDIHAIFQSTTLKRLESLRIYHLGLRGPGGVDREEYPYPLELLGGNPTFANLRDLAFHPHCAEYFHASYPNYASFLPLEQIKTILYSEHLTNLTGLQLRLSDMGDEGCREIVESGILKRLNWLDLRHGCITDVGAQILARCGDLKKLELLDLTRNALTEKGIERLQKTKVNFRAARQQTPIELNEARYLREGDFE